LWHLYHGRGGFCCGLWQVFSYVDETATTGLVAHAVTAPRVPLFDFPDVILHCDELTVKKHLEFAAAKGGSIVAADKLVAELVNPGCISAIRKALAKGAVELVAVHALETQGVNEIPAAPAKLIARPLALPAYTAIVQANSVGHTGAGGFHRLAHQAQFVGTVIPGRHYFLVDDFVGQGGTLANLIGFVRSSGGLVLGATVLTGKPCSAKLAPDLASIAALRNRYGQEFEDWWRQRFGFGVDCLTRSEARYLEKSADAETVRDRLAAAGLASGLDRSGSG
jgi:Phosphoribosyl transferase domain